MRERIKKTNSFYSIAKWFDHISVEEWERKYLPVNEHLLPMDGIYYQFLKRQPPNRIWTLCDAGDFPIIESGWHIVNAEGVYLTVIPCERNTLVWAFDDKEENADAEEENGDVNP